MGEGRSRSRISYCSRCGWSAEPSLSSPLPDSARCWRRPPEARSWVVSLLRGGNKQTSGSGAARLGLLRSTSAVNCGHPPAFTSASSPEVRPRTWKREKARNGCVGTAPTWTSDLHVQCPSFKKADRETEEMLRTARVFTG